jgi:hypothetical protein
MFCVKTRETVCEEIVVGEVPEAQVQKTGVSKRQHSLLSNSSGTASISPDRISLTKVKFSP